MGNRTFTMIKPEAVQAGNTGAILKIIEENGFRIIAFRYAATGKIPIQT